MKVQSIMTQPPQTCPWRMTLASASRRMREKGCGTLLALDHHGRLAGIVTDRDLALAIGLGEDPRTVTVEQVMTREVHTCLAGDDLQLALAIMAQHRIRRVPVLDHHGDVLGLISIDDIILWGLQDGLQAGDVIAALRMICVTERALIDQLG
jgi:CBS domain-containing protein